MNMVELNGVQVAECKKAYVEELIKAVSRQENTTGLILYGSVLEERCSEDSDLNVVITGTMGETDGYKVVSSIYDHVMDYDLDQEITALYYKDGSPEIKVFLDRGKTIWTR